MIADRGTLQGFIEQFTYLGIFTGLFLASLGLPIPEEMMIISAAVLSHAHLVRWWVAVGVCLVGVLSGDLVLYGIGHHWGRRALNWRLVRLVLTPTREQSLVRAYRQHAVKTVIIARHVVGLRAAAFLTAGMVRVPFRRFVMADAAAAVIGVPFVFGLAYFFTDHVEAILRDVHHVERWAGLVGLVGLVGVLIAVAYHWARRAQTGLVDDTRGKVSRTPRRT